MLSRFKKVGSLLCSHCNEEKETPLQFISFTLKNQTTMEQT